MSGDLFTNNQVHLSEVPQLAILEYSGLQSAYRNVSLISTTIFFAILTGAFFLIKSSGQEFIDDNVIWILSGLALLYVFSIVMTILGFKRKSYALRERDIVYNEGLIWQSSTVIPFNRVQHCEISQGPIERMFGLSELKVFTAGGSSSDMRVPGLDPDTAGRLKEYIVLKTGMDEEE